MLNAWLPDRLLVLHGFHGMLCLPGIEAAFQGRCPEAHLVQPPRRPGAGRFVRSGTVGDDALAFDLAPAFLLPVSGPLLDLVRHDPDATGDLGLVLLVLGAGAHVEDYGWVVALQHFGELFWFDPDRLGGGALEDAAHATLALLLQGGCLDRPTVEVGERCGGRSVEEDGDGYDHPGDGQ